MKNLKVYEGVIHTFSLFLNISMPPFHPAQGFQGSKYYTFQMLNISNSV